MLGCMPNHPTDRVDPAPTRRRLADLAALGIGHRRAAYLAGVAVSTIQRIRHAATPTIRRRVADAILAIERPSLAHGQRVRSYQTRRLIDSLEREGFTRAQLAARLGLRSGRLHLHDDRVTVRNALKVQALYQQLTAEGEDLGA